MPGASRWLDAWAGIRPHSAVTTSRARARRILTAFSSWKQVWDLVRQGSWRAAIQPLWTGIRNRAARRMSLARKFFPADRMPAMSTTPSPRPEGRALDALRPVRIETGVLKFAEGSALISLGDTRVLVAASVENRVPPFNKDSGEGWHTAESARLPRATLPRDQRAVAQGKPSGRT